MNARLQLRLLKKPEPRKVAPMPVYARVPLHGGFVVDRRAGFYVRWDAYEGELLRLASFHQHNGAAMASLGEEFPKEQARVREVLGTYREIGAPGAIGAMLIEQTLRRADQAVASGDVLAMLRSFEEMKGVKE